MLIELLGDLLSPSRCAACEGAVSRHHVFCGACAASVERVAIASGSREGAPVDEVAFGYYGGALAQAIRRLKYEDRPYLARPLGSLLRSACRDAKVRVDAIVPVPLHPRRLVSRGYNQSALLAAHVASELSKPLLPSALARKVDTLPQVDQSAHGRQTNVAAAFAVASPASIKGRMLGLIDDVVTTGATLGACREALLAAGARGVVRVVLARAPSSALRIPLGLDAAPLQNVGLDGARAS